MALFDANYPTGLTAYIGMQGAGKTYAMIKDAQVWREKGWHIVSNLALPWADEFTTWDEMIRQECTLILLDEAGIWFNARDRNAMNKQVIAFLSQQRKRGVAVWYTAQYADMVDKHIRILTHTWWFMSRWFEGLICARGVDGLCYRGGDGPDKTFTRRWMWIRDSICKLYDTYAILGDADGIGVGRGGAAALAEERSIRADVNSHFVREVVGPCHVRYRPPTVHEVLNPVGIDIFRRPGSKQGGFTRAT